ncbi:MAG TPA: hypothetical protein VM324_12000 [Egibacteraceae bacterium]|nr:hypothetical protein [Egibacteraceae bacterium]
MSVTSEDDGLSVVEGFPRGDNDADEAPEEDAPPPVELDGDADLETLRDEFVERFNGRDLDALLALVSEEVETPDLPGDGAPVFTEEVEAIWERSPGAMLTRAFLDGVPCAVAWLPDEDGCWSRAALVCFAAEDGLLSLVALPDDADALDRAEADDPTGEEIEEWSDWGEWDRGEETRPRPRDRARP